MFLLLNKLNNKQYSKREKINVVPGKSGFTDSFCTFSADFKKASTRSKLALKKKWRSEPSEDEFSGEEESSKQDEFYGDDKSCEEKKFNQTIKT